jgi:hypothetical protein
MTRGYAFGQLYAIVKILTAGKVKKTEDFFSSPAIFIGQYTRQYIDANEPMRDTWEEAMEALSLEDIQSPLTLAEQGDFWLGYYAVERNFRSPNRNTRVSTKEAAAILKIDQATVRQQLGAGRFPNAKKFGRDWQIPMGDVSNYRKKTIIQGTSEDIDRDAPPK